MQKELDKLSGTPPQIQACIDGQIKNASLEMTHPYGSCLVEMREPFRLVQAKRYQPLNKKLPVQNCHFNDSELLADFGPGIYHSRAFLNSYEATLVTDGYSLWRSPDEKTIQLGV